MIDKSSSYIKAGLQIRVELTGSESGFDPPHTKKNPLAILENHPDPVSQPCWLPISEIIGEKKKKKNA